MTAGETTTVVGAFAAQGWLKASSDPALEVTVTVDLKSGAHRATVWTNDLTHAYVHENSAYSS